MSALKGLTFVSSVHGCASKCLDLFQVLGLIIVDSKNASVSLKYTKENRGGRFVSMSRGLVRRCLTFQDCTLHESLLNCGCACLQKKIPFLKLHNIHGGSGCNETCLGP